MTDEQIIIEWETDLNKHIDRLKKMYKVNIG